jgi:murein DD-endopeptidase MepM/ murein hydrolase activator NlpD
VQERLGGLYAGLARTRAQLETARDASIAYAREAYMTAGQGLPVVAFSAQAVTDISLSIEYLHRLTASSERTVHRYAALEAKEDRDRLAVEAMEAEVAQQLEALEQDQEMLVSLQGLLQVRGDELQEEYERQRALLAEVEAEIALWEGEISALEKEQSAVRAVIDDSADPSGSAPGALVRPVPGAISSGFGPRVHPIYGTVKMHNGVDMNAAQSDPIHAAASGRVILAGVKGGYGNTVMIDHGGGMVTLYAHQSRMAVAVGATVSAGETIGYVGSTGTSTAPHLHFEVRINGSPVNPVTYL